ncbi:hypothetical protein CN286_12185 [Bacillus anthracis]|nr:hypothetical protein CN286_12185 [Bacillus anthracis]PFM46065.1 hypothetical protein COJ45_17905 [Bacillus cereus]PGS25474.1 hypothetical protein COC59_13180 [Bacillus cereus]
MGFGSDVIEVGVSPIGDTLFVLDGGNRVVNEIYIGDYRDISAIIQIYRLSGKKRKLSQTFF